MVHAGGRPREYDRIAVGKEFVQWAKTHPDCLTVPHFSTANGYCTARMLEWCKEDPEFRELYMEAKQHIGVNQLRATLENDPNKRPLDKTIYLRHIGNYDPDKRHFDREEKCFESKLKKEEQEPVPPEQSQKLKAIIDQLSEMQSDSKKARSNIKSDSQS